MKSLPVPTDSWKINAELLIENARQALPMISTLPLGVRMMVKAVGAQSILEQIANENEQFVTEEQAQMWFAHNEPLFLKALSLYDMAGQYLDGEAADVVQQWKTWFENNR